MSNNSEYNYNIHLQKSYKQYKNNLCLGFDAHRGLIPGLGAVVDYNQACDFFSHIIYMFAENGYIPAACKVNIAYYHALDKPFHNDFFGSRLLAHVITVIRTYFSDIPLILDSKRADIGVSSACYAEEAFDGWDVDALTVSPYMGYDSIYPFASLYGNKGVYVLNRTSNEGAHDVQNCMLTEQDMQVGDAVSVLIRNWNALYSCIGAVVGATHTQAFMSAVRILQDVPESRVLPLLIPGVGTQGAHYGHILSYLHQINYALYAVRINISRAIVSPWQLGAIPHNWAHVCNDAMLLYYEEAQRLYNVGV